MTMTEINNKIRPMRGWFNDADMVTFDFIFKSLNDFAIRGNCIEFGVFCGKSLSKIAQYLNIEQNEKILGVDVSLDAEPDRINEICSNIKKVSNANMNNMYLIKDFTNHLDKHSNVIEEFYKNSKFIHLDAAHTGYGVYDDLNIIERFSDEYTVLVIDDWFNKCYPHLQEAYYKYAAQNSNAFIPFLMTDSKCYLCKPAKHHDWMWKIDSEYINFLYQYQEGTDVLKYHYLIKSLHYLTHDTYTLVAKEFAGDIKSDAFSYLIKHDCDH